VLNYHQLSKEVIKLEFKELLHYFSFSGRGGQGEKFPLDFA